MRTLLATGIILMLFGAAVFCYLVVTTQSVFWEPRGDLGNVSRECQFFKPLVIRTVAGGAALRHCVLHAVPATLIGVALIWFSFGGWGEDVAVVLALALIWYLLWVAMPLVGRFLPGERGMLITADTDPENIYWKACVLRGEQPTFDGMMKEWNVQHENPDGSR